MILNRENWNAYQNAYHKSNYTQLVVSLQTEEAEELKTLLSSDNITFTALVKKAISDYKKDRDSIKNAKNIKFKNKKTKAKSLLKSGDKK